MNNIEFNTRLINILKMRNKLKRSELVDLLRQFWKHNKQQLQTIYHYHCYQLVVKVLNHFDNIILQSNNRYYYVYKNVLVDFVEKSTQNPI